MQFNLNNNPFDLSNDQVQLLYPQPGYVEIDPDELWELIIKVIKNTFRGRFQ